MELQNSATKNTDARAELQCTPPYFDHCSWASSDTDFLFVFLGHVGFNFGIVC